MDAIIPAELVAVLVDARELLAQPDNDFNWSSWKDRAAALEWVVGLVIVDAFAPPGRRLPS